MLRILFIISASLISASTLAIPEVSGMWLLNGPGSESEIKLTARGLEANMTYWWMTQAYRARLLALPAYGLIQVLESLSSKRKKTS